MDHNNPCLFCDKENQKFKLIVDSDFCVARWDANPVSKGHALIIPRTHVTSFFDLKDEELLEIFSLMKKVKQLSRKNINPMVLI